MTSIRSMIRIGTGLALALGLFGLAGCSAGASDGVESLGGGGGGGGSGGTSGTSIAQVAGVSAMLQWQDASGPVAGYHVLVSRNNGGFVFAADTATPQVAVSGAVGDVLRIEVAAFDASGNMGPLSAPSDPFQFAGPDPAVASAAASASGATSTSTSTSTGTLATASTGSTAAGSGGVSASGGSTSGGSSGAAPASAGAATSGVLAHADFDGDGATDLVWESVDGSEIRITHSDLSHARVFTSPDPSRRVAAIGDFDGDGLPDLLFSGSGQLALASGKALQASTGDLPLESWAPQGDGARVAASGDFDGDGSADVAIVDAAGASLWLATGAVVTLPAVDPGTTLVGAGDADGDGSDDLFFRDAQGGYSIWHVVGGEVQGTIALPAPEGASLLGVADFDGDGADDVALRTAPDTLVVQRAQPPFEASLEAAPQGRELAGCGDYDGDGSTDRLWADADSLQISTAAGGETAVPLASESSWQLVPNCQ